MEEKTWFAGRHVSREGGLSGAGVEELRRAGEYEAEQDDAGDVCRQADKNISISARAETLKKHWSAALCSHHMGHDNLPSKWWRDQVDKAGGGRVDLTQVCPSAAAAMPTATLTGKQQVKEKGGGNGRKQKNNQAVTVVAWQKYNYP